MNRATLIYNPVAGRNPVRRKGEIRAAAEVLRQGKLEVLVQPTTGPGTAEGIARSAVLAGASVVFVCGGDGTINEVVNGLASSECPLAILPGGTANIAARDLGLTLKPVAAAQEFLHARARQIALGRVTWERSASRTIPSGYAPRHELSRIRYFLSVAGIGFDAYVVYHLSWDLKRHFGVTAYLWKALEHVWGYGFPAFRCRSGEKEWRGRTALVQRTERYAGWLHLSPGSSLLDPRMRLFLFNSASPWRYFSYSASVILGRHLRLPDLQIAESWPLECEPDGAAKPIRVELDGEVAGELPATFEVVPNALQLLLPDRLADEARHPGPSGMLHSNG